MSYKLHVQNQEAYNQCIVDFINRMFSKMTTKKPSKSNMEINQTKRKKLLVYFLSFDIVMLYI